MKLLNFVLSFLFFFVSAAWSVAVPKQDWMIGGGQFNPSAAVDSGAETHDNYGVDNIAPTPTAESKLPGASANTPPKLFTADKICGKNCKSDKDCHGSICDICYTFAHQSFCAHDFNPHPW